MANIKSPAQGVTLEGEGKMKINAMIQRLEDLRDIHGNLEVTCTHSALADGYSFRKGRVCEYMPDVWETTAETLLVTTSKPEHFGDKHVRIYL